MPTPQHRLSDLRARRLARRLIEIADELAAFREGLTVLGEEEHRALELARDGIVVRLERAILRLDHHDPLRTAIQAAIDAHHDASGDRLDAALGAIRDAMRRSSPPPSSLGAR